ncbi:hypothetical protein C8R45DRAFT_1107387 [Mycena sanguinolenta]|nr:hypothetical protein C8R45DRAFT_1107387 [Mycena sanguinolenta]
MNTPALFPGSASAPSTYPAPGGYPSTSQLSLSLSLRRWRLRGTTPAAYYPGDHTNQEHSTELGVSVSEDYFPQA